MKESLIERKNTGVYPEPLSFAWRTNHLLGYLLGGFTFLIGSCVYLPCCSDYVLGGWMFTIGSAGFLYADCNEWWKNNRVGCAYYAEVKEDFEEAVGKHCEDEATAYGRYQRAENGINFMYSAFGSFLYLIGSILFIPDVGAIVAGTIVFIPGSLVIFTSQMWKLYRAGCATPPGEQPKRYAERTFSAQCMLEDWPAFGIDLFAGMGGFAYFIGSCLFLPGAGAAVTTAVAWFIVGGTSFTLSGLFMIYRYYCTQNYVH
jgi:hypothetical protein